MALNDIDTFVILMLENRSFDHAVGYLSLPGPNPPMAIDGLSDDPAWLEQHANDDDKGKAIRPFALGADVESIIDPPHNLGHIDKQINTATHAAALPKMGGFVKSYQTIDPPDPSVVMGYYQADTVAALDFFARHFAICDHWFSSLPTGTQPNRLMAMAGASKIKDNVSAALPKQPLVYDWLTRNEIAWCSYQWAGFPFFFLMKGWAVTILLSLSRPFNDGRFRNYEGFIQGFHEQWNGDAPIPNVIFIEPKYTDDPIHLSAPNDDHPPTSIAPGEDFLRRVYRTLISNPDRWKKTAMIVSYDEHGGFFDHVPPLSISDTAGGKQFGTTGVRVPALVISPQVSPGTPFHGNLDHTSILQLLAARFTPGKPNSAAVAARQQHLDPLRDVFVPLPAPVPAPQFPENIGAALHVFAATAPVPPVGPGAPRQTETAEAFHQVAHELAAKRPDLMTTPHGKMIAAYVAGTALTGGALPQRASARKRAAAPVGKKVRAKKKPAHTSRKRAKRATTKRPPR